MKYKHQLLNFAKKKGRSLAGFMTIPLWSKLTHIRSNASILCYHRIAPMEKEYHPSNLVVPPDMFEKHLSFLSSKFNVVSMDKILEHIENKTPVEDVAAITFDDGYSDFKTFALPLLHKFHLPATVYLCTDFLDGKGLQWWHLIDELLLSCKELKFSWEGKKYSIQSMADPEDAYNRIRSLFINSETAGHDELADKLITASKNNRLSKRKYKMMTWDDIDEIKTDPLVSIGAHTKSHCVLSRQKKDDAVKEMRSNKSRLENFLDDSVAHFAYPFGTFNEAGEREYALARSAGFSTGVTLIKGHVNFEVVDRFSIPRFHIPGGTFSVNQLRAMLSGLEMKVNA